MAEVIRMPRLSDTMEEGKIISWLKEVGDKVKPGDVLAEVETDKATMELESYDEGVLLYIGVEAGKAAKVEGVLAVIGKAGEDYQAALDASGSDNAVAAAADKNENKEEAAPAKEAAASDSNKGKVALPEGAKEIRMPLLSDTMTEGKIVTWNKKVGDKVKADDSLADVETDKATMEIVGYEEGTLLYVGVEEGQAAQVNEIIAIVGVEGTDVSAYVAGRELILDQTLRMLEAEHADYFMRVHRNALASRRWLRSIEKGEDGKVMVAFEGVAEQLEVSRRLLPAVRTALKG